MIQGLGQGGLCVTGEGTMCHNVLPMRGLMIKWRARCFLVSRAEDFFHGFSLGQFVDQFVEEPDFLHERVGDFLDAVAADEAGDFGCIRVELRCLGEERFEVDGALEDGLEFRAAVSRQPADDDVHFLLGASLFFRLVDVVGVDGGEGHSVDAVVVHGVGSRWIAGNVVWNERIERGEWRRPAMWWFAGACGDSVSGEGKHPA